MTNIETIDIILGGEVNIQPGHICQETLSKIILIITLAIQERDELLKQKISDETVQKCYLLLYERMVSQQPTGLNELALLANTQNLPYLIFKINKFIDSRGGLWELQKKKINYKTSYFLRPKFQ